MSTLRRPLLTAPRFQPLWGAAVGGVGAALYWLAAQIWPTSVAVVLSMLATTLLCGRLDATAGARTAAGGPTPAPELLRFVFVVLLKYNVLMALSAASLPFPLPANLALGLIMIAGHACSRALAVSMQPVSHLELGIALATGFAPAAIIGMPGLIGLAAAIAARIIWVVIIRRERRPITAAELQTAAQVTELCFYLGTLAAWGYS